MVNGQSERSKLTDNVAGQTDDLSFWNLKTVHIENDLSKVDFQLKSVKKSVNVPII